jgi:hypothetical protein
VALYIFWDSFQETAGTFVASPPHAGAFHCDTFLPEVIFLEGHRLTRPKNDFEDDFSRWL